MDIQFRDIFEQAAAGIAVINPGGSFCYINQKFCDTFGYSPQELLALSIRDIGHPEDQWVLESKIPEVRSGAIDMFEIDSRYLVKDGSAIWIHLVSNVKRDAAGQVEYVILTIFDITKRKQAEANQELSNVRFQHMFEEQKTGILILGAVGSTEDGTDDFGGETGELCFL